MNKLFSLWQSFKYGWSKFHRVLKHPLLNSPELGIWQGCEYMKVRQGA